MFKRMGFGFSMIALPFYNADGGAGGGGGFSGDAGGSNGSAAGGGQDMSGGISDSTNEPQAIELDENALIRVKGQDKPIKFGEYGRNFQSQWTRAAQENARLKQQLQRFEQEKRAWEQSQRQQAQVQNQGQGQGQGDIYGKLRELPYLTGEAAVEVVQGISDQIRQRDMVTLAALQKMKQMESVINQLYGTHVNQSFESKLDRWLDEGGYPREAKDLAKEIYLAYEGDDLDEEFPQIFKARWEQLNSILNTQRERQAAEARRNRFVPGKGGNVGPSAPLQFKGNERPEDIANALWDSLQESGT